MGQKLKKITFILFLVSFVYLAQASEELGKEMIDLPGWEAGEIEDASMNMAGFSFTMKSRIYSNEEQEFTITYIAGSNAMLQGYKMDVSIETSEVSFGSSEIDNFIVIKSYNKIENTGAYIVELASNEMSGAMLMITFSEMNDDKALEILKKFDWEKFKIQGEASLN